MSSLSRTSLFSFYLILVLASFASTEAIFSEHFPNLKSTEPAEKTTHLHFYFHDIVSGQNPTAVRIIGLKNSFGMTTIIDDPLTEGTDPNSNVVGRAQGFYAMASQSDSGLLMVMNFAFSDGKYDGSGLSILGGRKPVLDSVSEIPVVGGTGLFRSARGYALANTVRFDSNTGDATVEYNVFVTYSNDSNLSSSSESNSFISIFIIFFHCVFSFSIFMNI